MLKRTGRLGYVRSVMGNDHAGQSALRADGHWSGLEVLEPRLLLSGVTLITHGFGGTVEDWVTAMADAIADRPDFDADQPRYTVTVTDPGHDGGPLSVTPTAFTGPSPVDANTVNPEIMILLDWSDVAGSGLFGYTRSTVDVAAAVVAQLLTPGFLPSLPGAVAQLPLQLIGHSRGASLVAEMAKGLGTLGVWVDQLTLLDPHPVNGTNDPVDYGDAPMHVWSNVAFADDYWRADGLNLFELTDVDGEPVAGAHNLQLSESVLNSSAFNDPGYDIEHSDTHLWYHGTIDATGPIHDGSESVPEAAGWYDGSMGPRTEIGYDYSRIVGGDRPADGVAYQLGGDGSRVALDLSAAICPNVIDLAVTAGPDVLLGQDISVTYHYQDVDSAATIYCFLDADRNPYNSNDVLVHTQLLDQTGEIVFGYGSTIGTTGLPAGDYYLAACIADGAYARAMYAPDPITLWNWPTGDFNGDGLANLLDINPFVLAMTDWPTYIATHPDANVATIDPSQGANPGDPVITLLDITPFVELLTGGGGASLADGEAVAAASASLAIAVPVRQYPATAASILDHGSRSDVFGYTANWTGAADRMTTSPRGWYADIALGSWWTADSSDSTNLLWSAVP